MSESLLTELFSPIQKVKIGQSKVLLVGCGGVGCELIKNIIKLGFRDIFLIDNDYVDISNLNRQFYYNRAMINRSKALSIRDMLKKEYPHIKVDAEYSDIQSHRFLSSFYKQFTLVLCALDNREAKEHLTYMCLKYNLPMIIVGAEGFNGQVRVFMRGKYECIFCDPTDAELPDSISVCNVKGTPTTSNDCIIWAKFFLDDLLAENRQFMRERNRVKAGEEVKRFWENFFDETFHWEESPKLKDFKKINHLKYELAIKNNETLECSKSNQKDLSHFERLKTISQYTRNFVETMEYIYQFNLDSSNRKLIENDYKKLSLYSGDEKFIDFLTACTNLRIHIYRNVQALLEYQHEYQVKKIVCKIVPSIASTNSIIAGLQISETIKLLLNPNYEHKTKWVTQEQEDIINPTMPSSSNFDCKICSLKCLYFGFYLDFEKKSLLDLITCLRKYKEFNVGTIFLLKQCIYDSLDDNMKFQGLNDQNLNKNLRNLLEVLCPSETMKECHLVMTNDHKKISFDFHLVLIDQKSDDISPEDENIAVKIKENLEKFYSQKKRKEHHEKYKFLKKIQKKY